MTDTGRPALRILSLGDSYTIGESVPAVDRWPAELARRLEAAGYPSAEAEVIARTGWTTFELDAGIDAADPSGPFDLVTLLIGVNNQFRGLDIEEFRSDFAALVERAFGLSAAHVVVVSIPDWGVTPFGVADHDPPRVAEEIDAFNAVAHDESVQRGAHWVDVTHVSRSSDADLLATDGLHPSAEQYRRWVDLIEPVVLRLLDEPVE